MDKKIGFIGCGNMGKAILGGLIASGQVQPGQIWVYTPSPDKVAALRDQYGINAASSAQEVAQIADIVFGAVKPGIMTKVLGDIASSLNKESLVVSIAAGVTLEQLARALGHDRKIIRAMPNTPSLVNAGMTSVTPNALVSSEDVAEVLTIFRCFGQAEQIAEPMIHPVVGVSGSAPAYVFMFIEAMADAPSSAECRALRPINSPPRRDGLRQNGAGERRTPRGAERYGLFPWRDHHRSRARAGRERVPLGGNRSHHPVYGKIRETEPLLKLSRRASSPERLKNKGARALPFFQAFFRQLLMKVLRSSPFSDFAVAALLQSLIFCC